MLPEALSVGPRLQVMLNAAGHIVWACYTNAYLSIPRSLRDIHSYKGHYATTSDIVTYLDACLIFKPWNDDVVNSRLINLTRIFTFLKRKEKFSFSRI